MLYREIDSQIWIDAGFKSLTGDAKIICFLVMTHPSFTGGALFKFAVCDARSELGWDIDRFTIAVKEAAAHSFFEIYAGRWGDGSDDTHRDNQEQV